MKAITICQPYAHLIAAGKKPVENRTWNTSYRGQILIHAGKSRNWLNLDPEKTKDAQYEIKLDDMAFGAVVAVANLVDCVHIREITLEYEDRFPQVSGNEHVEGPYCWVLDNVQRLIIPYPATGAQQIWELKGRTLYDLGELVSVKFEPTLR